MANIIDPAWALKTSSLLVPTSSAAVEPTVVPDPPEYQLVGETGSTTLWIVFAIQFIASVAFILLAWRVPVQKRLFNIITALITIFASLSYYAMATGDGVALAHFVVTEVHKHAPDTVEEVYRQVYFARYIDWAVTTPLLLLDLSFLAGLSGADILVAVVADVIMILTGLFAAFAAEENSKWGWYAISCAAYLFIVYILAVGGRRAVSSKSNATSSLFAAIGGFTLILWTLYPIVWGIADGARKWSVDTEIVAYAILDVLAKPVFGFWLLLAHGKNIPAIEGFWSQGLTGEGNVRLDDEEA